MATRVLDDAFVSIGGTDFSDHVRSVTPKYGVESLDETAMGTGTRKHKGGLKDWGWSIEFYGDEAASQVTATLFALVGTVVALIVRPDKSEGVSATNPNYSGSALLVSFPPIGGRVGELHVHTAEFESAGTLTRATA